jgi:hypothetical protein
MASIKSITLRYNDATFTAAIEASMTETEFYQELRTALDNNRIDIGDLRIVVMDPTRNNEKVYLHYQHLKVGKPTFSAQPPRASKARESRAQHPTKASQTPLISSPATSRLATPQTSGHIVLSMSFAN